jgi:hypothetical protein
LFETALATLVFGAGILSQPLPDYRLESLPTAGGAELVTVFAHVNGAPKTPDLDIPILAVLRDSLGDDDPDNDRLRSVWILTSTRPTPWQRAASALTFGYFRAGSKQHTGSVPSPALDLASPAKSVYGNLLSDGVQAIELDPMGAPIRATTRTYRTNSDDYTKLQVFQALSNLDNMALHSPHASDANSVLPDSQLREIYSRLSLSTRTFGGLVRERNLSRYYDKETSRQQQTRGHNWELLRQRAELNGLYFDPLTIGDAAPSQALLWIARSDLDTSSDRRYDGQFLNIANPWTDSRLEHWTGYSQIRYFDAENRPVTKDTSGAHAVEMIPLALYSLDYPRVPFLLVDFRRSMAPKRREMINKGATGVATGVLGLTRFGNPSFFAAEWVWTFVRGRHGAAVNPTARLQAYSHARQFLAMDSSMDLGLKAELEQQLDHLALNPRENEISHEATLAREQYGSLVAYENSPQALAKLQKSRRKELESYTRPAAVRLLSHVSRLITGGPDVDSKKEPALRAKLGVYRARAAHERFLELVLAASPRPDVAWDADAIRKSVEALSADPDAGPQAEQLIEHVYARSSDASLRTSCWRALEALHRQIPSAHEASLAPAPPVLPAQ